MKRFLLPLTILVSIAVKAQTNTWTGGLLGNWGNGANWSQGHTPTSSEDVVINTNSSINVNSFAGNVRAIRSLKITGGVSVKLTCTVNGTRYLRMSSTSTSQRGLVVDAGNTLIFDATNTTGTGFWICDLTGTAGVTGLIDGTLQFEGTGSGSGGASLNVYTGASNNANLVVSNTGKIIHMLDTGDDNGGTGSYLNMQSGSVYEQQEDGGSIPFGNWNAGSTVKVITNGATPPVFAGNIYGNVEINCTGLTSPIIFNKDISFNDFNLVSTGAGRVTVKSGAGAIPYVLTINGTLTVSPASTLEATNNTNSGDGTGWIKLKGHIINNGTITENAGGSGNSTVELNGTSNQNISGSGTWVGNHFFFTMNNPAGATLLSPLLLKCNMILTSGKIRTTATNIFTMSKGPVNSVHWEGGSSASFVEGPMKYVGTGTGFTFPVGKGNFFAPIRYENLINYFLSDTLMGEYFRINPGSVYGHNYNPAASPSIDHISTVEYWSVNKISGTTPGTRIVISVNQNSFCTDSNLDSTFIARYDAGAGQWTSCATFRRDGISNSPPYVFGDIGTNPVPAFGMFTLATNSGPNPLGNAVQSPLPIHLFTFDATKINSSSALVTWQLADFSSAAEKFDVQRAGNDRNFVTITTQTGKENDRFYNYTDNELKTGVNLYRVRMTDKDGRVSYTRIVAIINEVKGFLLTSLMPTIVTQSTRLTVASSDKQRIDIIVTDMQGRVMLRRNFSIAAGNTNIDLSMEKLQSGAYALTAVSEQGQMSTIRFIKQ
ncbi:MAG TPA: T9SS type A sorting domain-containing protein [Chitinophagaceae bacterium]|nr:T9SS type A sorting domain-containing protein [Chitinophagaceae bacterium]